ncbi:hypothetical protein [Polyangium sorediatum]|uniref:Uncharacterized protein n=1 Tax=Polyangium sorediatum TaxID=889274 RepID=A0ABT6NVD3_9BACT|nr:hypothetical protein [Polyangium sorediatum]MDI1432256.1 hypothetical protein [Polyangium sorediatum]
MSQKPPERSNEETGDQGQGPEGKGAADRGARKPVVPRGLGLAGDTVRPPQPVVSVSFGDAEPLPEFIQERETLPPPVPMEQLVAQMMRPEASDEPRAGSAAAETIPPPASDVDTVRPRGDDAKTIPPRGDDTIPPRPLHEAKTIPPRGDDTEPPQRDDAKTMPPRGDDTLDMRQDDLATMPPPMLDQDTLPGVAPGLLEEHEPLYRGIAARESSSSLTARALDTADAVFEELGVEFFRARDTIETEPPPRTRETEPPRSRPTEEPPRSHPTEPPRSRPADEPVRARVPAPMPTPTPTPTPEETPRPRPIDERPRIASRLTPPRTVKPTMDAPPPAPPSNAGRPSHRRRGSETGSRSAESLMSGERSSPVPSVPVSERLNEVRARYEAGDHRAALALAEAILADAPDNIGAFSYAESSRQMLKQKYMARIGETSLVPRLKASVEELARGLDERGRMIVASIDGVASIEDIIGATGLPTIEVLRVVHDLLVAHRLDLATFPRGRR